VTPDFGQIFGHSGHLELKRGKQLHWTLNILTTLAEIDLGVWGGLSEFFPIPLFFPIETNVNFENLYKINHTVDIHHIWSGGLGWGLVCVEKLAPP
jgi:hypothetical protein